MNKLVLISILFLITFFGCRQPKEISNRYYVIEMPAEQNYAFKDTLPGIDKFCEVGLVDIFPAFASNRIAVRERSHEIEYFKNHEWATRPAENFTSIIVDFFGRYDVFEGVGKRFWKIIPDYRFETTVYQLEVEQKNKKELAARLNLEFRLIDNHTNEVIIKHSADRRKHLDENKINLFAAAISEMFYQELTNVTKKIATTVPEP